MLLYSKKFKFIELIALYHKSIIISMFPVIFISHKDSYRIFMTLFLYIRLFINHDYYISTMTHFSYIGIMSIVCLLRNYALSQLIVRQGTALCLDGGN